MAKKTAASKGFRKQEKKKPFLTKKELIALIVIVVVVIAAFAIVDKIQTRGYTRRVAEGDITTYASTEMKNYYLKMGEINELEGYTMEIIGGGGKNQTYKFYPVEESDISYVSVSGGVSSADVLVNSIRSMESETLPFYDTVETTINGLPAYVYAYSSSRYEAPEGEEAVDAENQEPNKFTQSVGVYFDYNEGHAISMHVYIESDSADCFVAEEDMVDFITPFADAFTVYQK